MTYDKSTVRLMSIQALLKQQPLNQRLDLVKLARKGILRKYLKDIQDFTSFSDKEIVEILPISQRQLIRYKADHILNKEITTHLIQIIELFQKGYAIFGTTKFKIWIRTENKTLSNHKPIDLMDTSLGIEMIEDILGRIEYGVYS